MSLSLSTLEKHTQNKTNQDVENSENPQLQTCSQHERVKS